MNLVRDCRASLSHVVLVGFILISSACTTNTVKKVNSAPTGVVAGTLTIDGKPTSLRYVYTREHAARKVDIDRLGLRHGETIDSNVISVILSNEPISGELIDGIADDTAKVPASLIGIFLTIDPSRAYHWESQFLVNSERISLFGYTTTGGDSPRIDDGRIRAKLALTNQDAIHQRAFLIAFDSPLSLEGTAWTPGFVGTSYAASCGAASLFEEYKKAMPGRWVAESWPEQNGISTKATLTVHEEVGGEQFLGTFHFVVSDGRPDIEEQVSIDCVDSKVHIRGAVIPQTPWAADSFVLELHGKNRLVGTGRDEVGRTMQVALKKTP